MGANHSTSPNGAGGASGGSAEKTVTRCYYEILGVGREASDDEIKRSYRRKALELHPDRNYGNVEESTALFAEVQAAYEVLSDPQERAWYDSHREAILRGGDVAQQDFDHDIRMTAANDLVRLLASLNGKVDANGPTNAFYTLLDETFPTLSREESLACEWQGFEVLDYPTFGGSDDSWELVVKPFYAAWSGFSTRKSFAWRDVYRLPDAPDRRVRRAMEKENKRMRDEGVREFNDAVRSLVAFAKKRDPRFHTNAQTEAQRQKTLQDAARAQAERSRMANQARLREFQETQLPAWASVNSPNGVDEEEEERSDVTDEEEQVTEHPECVICNKTFKSENQFEAHERSKKHIKAVQALRKTLRKEEKTLHLSNDMSRTAMNGDMFDILQSGDGIDRRSLLNNTGQYKGSGSSDGESMKPEASLDPDMAVDSDINIEHSPSMNDTVSMSSDEDDIYAPRETVEKRISAKDLGPAAISGMENLELDGLSSDAETSEIPQAHDAPVKPKLGKAKEKRLKKAAQKESGSVSQTLGFKCVACEGTFPSKTKLFNHIKDLGHAQAVPTMSKTGKKKG